ncbi:hypothetical protein F5888DRAFT_1669386 [Russula emetica]|nr:hypothetical protein F5888DRAFT_1669386 [Russula emetica]
MKQLPLDLLLISHAQAAYCITYCKYALWTPPTPASGSSASLRSGTNQATGPVHACCSIVPYSNRRLLYDQRKLTLLQSIPPDIRARATETTLRPTPSHPFR